MYKREVYIEPSEIPKDIFIEDKYHKDAKNVEISFRYFAGLVPNS